MTHRLITWLAALLAVAVFGGCYTVLQAPFMASSYEEEPEPSLSSWAADESDAPMVYDEPRGTHDPYGYNPYDTGYPVFGHDSYGGLYGFGSPFAYGPGYGAYAPGYGSYGYGHGSYGYGGPYGYGYDPYYTGTNGSYIPPGYQLVTTQELADLRAASDALRTTSIPGTTQPAVSQAQRRQQEQAASERAWERRTQSSRPATAEHRTPKPAPTPKPKAVSSSSSSSSSSSDSKSSGSSAAKRRKKRR